MQTNAAQKAQNATNLPLLET